MLISSAIQATSAWLAQTLLTPQMVLREIFVQRVIIVLRDQLPLLNVWLEPMSQEQDLLNVKNARSDTIVAWDASLLLNVKLVFVLQALLHQLFAQLVLTVLKLLRNCKKILIVLSVLMVNIATLVLSREFVMQDTSVILELPVKLMPQRFASQVTTAQLEQLCRLDVPKPFTTQALVLQM